MTNTDTQAVLLHSHIARKVEELTRTVRSDDCHADDLRSLLGTLIAGESLFILRDMSAEDIDTAELLVAWTKATHAILSATGKERIAHRRMHCEEAIETLRYMLALLEM